MFNTVVTSKLHAVQEADLKDGKDVAQYGTKVASFGGYGENSTEDNYFYRGVNNTPYSATLASDLKIFTSVLKQQRVNYTTKVTQLLTT